MTITFVTREKLQEFIKEICFSPIDKFTPSKFAKFANISIDDSFELLIDHVATKELELIWELRCPNCNRVNSLDNSKDFDEYECNFCCETFDIDGSDLYPKFRISKKYRDHLVNSKNDGDSGKKFEKAVANISEKNIPLSSININEPTWKIIQKINNPFTINIINGGDNVNINSNSFNNADINNSNIQSINNNQINIVPEQYINDLENDIKNFNDEVIQEMNEKYLEDLKKSLKNNDKENAKKFLSFMEKTLGSLSSIATISGYLN